MGNFVDFSNKPETNKSAFISINPKELFNEFMKIPKWLGYLLIVTVTSGVMYFGFFRTDNDYKESIEQLNSIKQDVDFINMQLHRVIDAQTYLRDKDNLIYQLDMLHQLVVTNKKMYLMELDYIENIIKKNHPNDTHLIVELNNLKKQYQSTYDMLEKNIESHKMSVGYDEYMTLESPNQVKKTQ